MHDDERPASPHSLAEGSSLAVGASDVHQCAVERTTRRPGWGRASAAHGVNERPDGQDRANRRDGKRCRINEQDAEPAEAGVRVDWRFAQFQPFAANHTDLVAPEASPGESADGEFRRSSLLKEPDDRWRHVVPCSCTLDEAGTAGRQPTIICRPLDI